MVGHVCAKHITAGQTPPVEFLRRTRTHLCVRCATLVPQGGLCGHCGCEALPGVPPEHRTRSTHPPLPENQRPFTGVPLAGAPPQFTPTIADVLKDSVPTVRHLPNAAREPFATLLNEALTNLAGDHPTWEALYTIMCAPKLVLAAPHRGEALRPGQ